LEQSKVKGFIVALPSHQTCLDFRALCFCCLFCLLNITMSRAKRTGEDDDIGVGADAMDSKRNSPATGSISSNGSSSSDSNNSSSNDNEGWIGDSQLNQNDVLMGRGNKSVRHQGNVRFRKLIQDRQEAYSKTGNQHQAKTDLAKDVIAAVHARHGRFLRRMTNTATNIGSSTAAAAPTDGGGGGNSNQNALRPARASGNLWEPVEEEVVIVEKIKQTFRDMINSSAQQQRYHNHPHQHQQNQVSSASNNANSSSSAPRRKRQRRTSTHRTGEAATAAASRQHQNVPQANAQDQAVLELQRQHQLGLLPLGAASASSAASELAVNQGYNLPVYLLALDPLEREQFLLDAQLLRNHRLGALLRAQMSFPAQQHQNHHPSLVAQNPQQLHLLQGSPLLQGIPQVSGLLALNNPNLFHSMAHRQQLLRDRLLHVSDNDSRNLNSLHLANLSSQFRQPNNTDTTGAQLAQLYALANADGGGSGSTRMDAAGHLPITANLPSGGTSGRVERSYSPRQDDSGEDEKEGSAPGPARRSHGARRTKRE
jgi:hypothetical protein